MSKLFWSIWLLLLNGFTALALPTGTAEIPACLVHCPQPIVALSFDYDGSSTSIFDYDGVAVYTANECASQSASSHAAFATSAEFLAAEGTTASITTPYAVEVQSSSAEAQAALAQAQNGATLYRTGQLGTSMTGESQYWSLASQPKHA